MGLLSDVQSQVVSLLEADKYFGPIQVLPENKGDVATEIKTQLAKLGIVAIVMTVTGSVKGTDAPGPQMDPLRIAVDVCENVLMNRGANGSKLAASDVAERVLWRLHAANWPTRGEAYRLIGEGISGIPDKTLMIYRVQLRTAGFLAGLTTEE